MQFHLNGFKPGDPDVSPAAAGHRRAGDPLPDTVDVLIAGSGPAGLCLAAQLARVPQIRTLLAEPRLGPMEKGQADGISVRSMEMFQAFGFGEKVMRESVWINETTFWAPGEDASLARVARVQDVPDGISEMPHVLINQARVHDMFLDIMRHSPTRLEPDYGLKVVDLSVDPGAAEYPVTVTLEHTAPGREGQVAKLRANYVIGCDGARSNVRSAIGGALHGDAAHHAWGVMDVLAVTDFPDWRMKSFVRSQDEGILMVLPREGGHLVRLYVELDRLGEHERAADRGMGAQDIIAKAQRIFRPFELDVKEVVWWSIYEIGHRLTDKFDDVPADQVATRAPRVMLAGDACHTHSPKAGQGMNVSMGDTFNLGWKLISVLTGRADASLLHSYSGERRAAAKGLVEFDHKWARVVGARAEQDLADSATDGLPRVAREFVNNLPFTCGLTIQYERSALTGAPTHQQLATGFDIGKRFHSAPVVRLADAKPMHLGHCIEADARFHLFVFAPAGDAGGAGGAVATLCEWLEHDPASPMRRHTAAGEDVDAVIDTRAVFQQGFRELDYGAMPALLRPHVGRHGLCDYEKVFCADLKRDEDIFAMRGIDRAAGCVVVVRPDQYVGHVLPLQARDALAAYFAAILRVRG
ncbi:FAD-dependent monooxygenase [Piscinibacter sp.]|jgi:phenol 2-monooxygenase|uniref:FAD-dependent monooxygenase n=1 Tax=Piscinibacter sp. TaxID=1903157 RepID=UPI001B6D96F0|nr:FAD-dependent monooxygenase [Piscinibacter sp.]MBK7530716.1 FAD-dependent monooxygenase [Piscinibacter sp.]MBP6542245.1 FAD-dependent monooxygenase [Piscinibacter sp.]